MKTLLTLITTPIWWLNKFINVQTSEETQSEYDWDYEDLAQLDRETQSDDGDSRWYHLKAEAGYEGYEEYRDYE